MPKKLDTTIAEVLKSYGFGADACWDCHGTWVVYHKVLERIAAKAGIVYREPTILVAEKDAAAILVAGTLNDKSEWSIGEAMIGQNYKVSGKQAAYPFAMAEKRAKDRVILKLIGLHGLAYSEEEADEFRDRQLPAEPQQRHETAELPQHPPAPSANVQTFESKADYIRWCHAQIDAHPGQRGPLTEWWSGQANARRRYRLTQDEVDSLLERMRGVINRPETVNVADELADEVA